MHRGSDRTGDPDAWPEDPHEFYLDHYQAPRNRRTLAGADAAGTVQAPNGAVLTIALSLGRDDSGTTRIADAAFQSERCGVALAYASLLTDLLPGLTLAEAATLQPEALMARFSTMPIAGAAAGLAVSALRVALAHAARYPRREAPASTMIPDRPSRERGGDRQLQNWPGDEEIPFG